MGGAVLLNGGVTVLASGTGETYSFDNVRTEEDRVSLLAAFGIEVKTEGAEEENFTMPADLDRVLLGYNEVQKRQGLDIGKYTRKKITRYTYEVTNAKCDAPVYATLLIYRGRVIGADVASGDPAGFLLPLTEFGTIAEG